MAERSTIPLVLGTRAFVSGAKIPRRHTGEGRNISPPFHWTDVPEETSSFAMLMEDPDAPQSDPWVHWVMWGIPGDCRSLPEGVPRATAFRRPEGLRQGRNSWHEKNIGYRGPEPPIGHGRHRYYFRLYALDTIPDLDEHAGRDELLEAIDGHTLAWAEVMGTYER
jgi:Raf kinase inhibitor-like YbhB/YbcL family protein